jgi:hypothetical protein
MTEEQKKAIDACKDQAAKEIHDMPWKWCEKHLLAPGIVKMTDRAMQLYGEQCRPNWISVSEEMPPVDELVFGHTPHYKIDGGSYQAVYLHTNGSFISHTSGKKVFVGSWMPIPKLTPAPAVTGR